MISLLLCLLLGAQDPPLRQASPGEIAVGVEYVGIDNPRLARVLARTFSEIGLTAVKHYPEHVEWDRMQRGPHAKIDFTRLDTYVREFQAAGFGELVLCLKSRSRWASRKHSLLRIGDNPVPKREYLPHYGRWIATVVERYDGDGVDDMPGLRSPVRYLEIGSEFSSYEPEPVGEYLEMLEVAYKAAHRAHPNIRVGHAAFLTITAFRTSPPDTEEGWTSAFAGMDARIKGQHDLADMRAILDRPDLFDFLNIHSLGDPYEIEDIVRWLRYEGRKRGYAKPIVCSDVVPTSFAGFGPATRAEGPKERLALVHPPAREEDRARLAAYFQRLIRKDRATLDWLYAFLAADNVQRTVIAAEQGLALINLAFTIDLPGATWPVFRAGAGNAGWSGFVELRGLRVTERRPMFHAVRQMMGRLRGYRSIQRLRKTDDRVRLYEVEGRAGRFWIAWLNPKRLLLPGDEVPRLDVEIKTGRSKATLEKVATAGSEDFPRRTQDTPGGVLRVTLSPTPLYIH